MAKILRSTTMQKGQARKSALGGQAGGRREEREAGWRRSEGNTTRILGVLTCYGQARSGWKDCTRYFGQSTTTSCDCNGEAEQKQRGTPEKVSSTRKVQRKRTQALGGCGRTPHPTRFAVYTCHATCTRRSLVFITHRCSDAATQHAGGIE